MPRRTGGFVDGMAGGVSRLAAAVGGGGSAYQKAYEDETSAQTKLGLAVAQMQAQRAKAAQDNAETGVLQSRPKLFEEQVANASGVDVPTVQGYRQKIQTGVGPQVPMGPETEDGHMGVGSMQFEPEVSSKLAGAIKQYMPLLANMKDLKPDDLAQADAIYRQSRLSDEILAGRANRNDVGGAQAAAGGKDLFNRDSTGSVLDQFTGKLDESSGLAQSKIAENRAQAAHQLAQASAARAGGGNAPSGYRWKADGTLERIPGGPADISEKKGAPTEDERKGAGWFEQAQFAFDNMNAALGKDPSAGTPGMLQSVAGSVPGIGPAVKNSLNSEARQQYEQAAGSFAEAALRAATGAGVNKDEALQKIRELTPQFGDKPGTRDQKKAALIVYLNSLRSRAGRALPETIVAPSYARNPMGQGRPQAAQPEPARISSDDDYNALPSGTVFVAPDGSRRRKP